MMWGSGAVFNEEIFILRCTEPHRRMSSALHSAQLARQILAGLQAGDCVSPAAGSLTANDAFLLEAAVSLHRCMAQRPRLSVSHVRIVEVDQARMQVELIPRCSVCSVGLFVSHAGHHRHAAYIIRNSEHLLGFAPAEVELIALLARYHRCDAQQTPRTLPCHAVML